MPPSLKQMKGRARALNPDGRAELAGRGETSHFPRLDSPAILLHGARRLGRTPASRP